MGGYSCSPSGCSRITPTTTCAEQPSSSIGRARQHLPRARTTMHGLRLRETMEAHASMECATRSTRLPRAREATAAGRVDAAAPHPPPRVLSSLSPRSVAFGSALLPRAHTSNCLRETIWKSTRAMRHEKRMDTNLKGWEGTITPSEDPDAVIPC